MKKQSGITPFANKVYELARNFQLTAELLENVEEIVDAILSRNEDLPILLEELECSEEELLEASFRFYEIKAEAESIAQQACSCKARAKALAKEVLSDKYFGTLLDLPVVRPHRGIFDPTMLTIARKVGATYIQKLRRLK